MSVSSDRRRLFCSKPFTWFEVSRGQEEGDVFMCCPSWLETPIGNLTRQTVQEVWNGVKAQQIRSSILDGSFRYCNRDRCPHLQTVTEPVQAVEDVSDPYLLEVLQSGSTVLDRGPREINCSYDQSCNLSCPSCRTGLIVDIAGKDRILGIEQKLRREALPDAELLYITGSGDPFGSPFFRRWLRTMRREEMPRLTTIRLHSNGLLWTPKMWETIPAEIRELIREANISIDAATDETYAVNRRGGRFQVLRENLLFLRRLREEGPLVSLVINMCVQANNFREMAAFVELGHYCRADTVAFHQLVDWGTYGEGEFAQRAVHLPSHAEHEAFLDVLDHPALRDPSVDLTNLTSIYRQRTGLGRSEEISRP